MTAENPKVKELVKVLEGQLQAKPDSRLIVFTVPRHSKRPTQGYKQQFKAQG